MKAGRITLLLALFATLFALLPALAFAQSSSTSQTTSGQGQSTGSQGQSSTGSTAQSGQQSTGSQSSTAEPVPYKPGEFPAWLVDLRRGEVITIGAFPIALLISSLSYQLARYAINGFAASYAPSLFGGGSTPLTNQEKTGVIISGAGLSVLIAVIDYTLGRAEKKQ